MEANKIDRLRHIIDNIRQLNDEWFDTFPTDDGQTSIHDALECEVIDANKILDLPLRNCDVGTAEEQNTRHKQFCYAQMKRNNHCCGPCPCFQSINGEVQPCVLIWAHMPYEAKEGGAE